VACSIGYAKGEYRRPACRNDADLKAWPARRPDQHFSTELSNDQQRPLPMPPFSCSGKVSEDRPTAQP
jgi:hypothetical protein